jgi:hypothetical protein
VFTEDALPAVQPVNFRLWHDDVVIVAFEADELDPDLRMGWRVTVVGLRIGWAPVTVGRVTSREGHVRAIRDERPYAAVAEPAMLTTCLPPWSMAQS